MTGRHVRILREEQVRFARERVFGIRDNMPGDRYFQKPLEGRELMRHHFPSKFGFQDFKVQDFIEMHEERFRPRKTHEFREKFKDTLAQIEKNAEVQRRLKTYFSHVSEETFYNSEPLQDLYSLYRMAVSRSRDDTLHFAPNPKVHLHHTALSAHYPFLTPEDAFTYDKWLVLARFAEDYLQILKAAKDKKLERAVVDALLADVDAAVVDFRRALNAAEGVDAKRAVVDATMAELRIHRPMFLDPAAVATLDFYLIIERAPECDLAHDDGFFCKQEFMKTLQCKRDLSTIRQFLHDTMHKYQIQRPLVGEHRVPRRAMRAYDESEDSTSPSSSAGETPASTLHDLPPTQSRTESPKNTAANEADTEGFDISFVPSEAEADALVETKAVSGEANAGGAVKDLSTPASNGAKGAAANEADTEGFDISFVPSEAEADALVETNAVNGEANAGDTVQDLSTPAPNDAKDAAESDAAAKGFDISFVPSEAETDSLAGTEAVNGETSTGGAVKDLSTPASNNAKDAAESDAATEGFDMSFVQSEAEADALAGTKAVNGEANAGGAVKDLSTPASNDATASNAATEGFDISFVLSEAGAVENAFTISGEAKAGVVGDPSMRTPSSPESAQKTMVSEAAAAGGAVGGYVLAESRAPGMDNAVSGEASAWVADDESPRPTPNSVEVPQEAPREEDAPHGFNWDAVPLAAGLVRADKASPRGTTLREGRVEFKDVYAWHEILASVGEPAERGHPENNPMDSTFYQKRHRFIDPMFRRRRLKWLERLQSSKNNEREIKYNQYYMAHPDNQERWPLNKGSVTVQYPSRYH